MRTCSRDLTARALAPALALGLALAAAAAAWTPARAAGPAARDVLDTPALSSPYASRSLLNGLARAGDRIVSVGQRGHVLLSDDGGRSWVQAEVPVSSDLVAVSFPDAKNGWAVGHDGVVLRTTDSGVHWTLQLDGRRAGEAMVRFYAGMAERAVPGEARQRAEDLLAEARRFAAQGAENPLLDVWFSDAGTGFVVGAFGLAFRTTDGGASWEPLLHALDNPKALHLYAVRGIGGEILIAGEQGLLLRFDPGSARFRAVDIPYKGTLFGVTGGERALLVHGLRGSVLRSGDAGRSWQPVRTGVPVGLTASTTTADGRILIASQAGHVLASSDDGANFAPLETGRPVPAAAVVVAADGSLVVAGPRGVHKLSLP